MRNAASWRCGSSRNRWSAVCHCLHRQSRHRCCAEKRRWRARALAVILKSHGARSTSKAGGYVFSVVSPLLFRKGERIEVRGFWREMTAKRNPHPALSLENREVRGAKQRVRVQHGIDKFPNNRFTRRQNVERFA